MAGDHDKFAPVIGERIVEREPGTLYTRQGIEFFFELPVERGEPRLRVGCRWTIQIYHHAPLYLVTKILMLELIEAAAQHRRPCHEYDGDGGLHHEQRFAREGRTILGAAARTAQGV